jgi:signal transduction histidine kinase
MRDHLILTAENALAFERSIHFLQQTLTEFRRISFGMMPEFLYKNGLDEALRQKCAEISAASSIEIQYHSSGLQEDRLSRDGLMAVYRIIQELLDIARKQPYAQSIYVRVTQIDGKLQVNVDHEGEGVDMSQNSSAKGSGLRHIQQQVESLKGNMHVDSVNGKGTRVHIALHI